MATSQTLTMTAVSAPTATARVLTCAAMCDLIEARTGNATAGDALVYLKGGYAWFLSGIDPRDDSHHDWSFLKPRATRTLWPTVTGTIASIGGTGNKTITASAASFYPSMEGSTFTADTSETTYEIVTYTSSTVIVVDASATDDEGDTFTITADGRYGLPSDYDGMVDYPVYAYDGDDLPDLQKVSAEDIARLRRDDNETGDPTKWAVQIRDGYDTSVGDQWDLLVHPVPDEVRTIAYRYRRLPGVPADSAVYLPGSKTFSYTILQAAMADAEHILGDVNGVDKVLADRMMIAAISQDRARYQTGDDAQESLAD